MSGIEILGKLEKLIHARHRELPPSSYTTQLFTKGSAHIRRKIIEEAGESITAESPAEIIAESADLVFHLMVYWETEGIKLQHIIDELSQRMQRHLTDQ